MTSKQFETRLNRIDYLGKLSRWTSPQMGLDFARKEMRQVNHIKIDITTDCGARVCKLGALVDDLMNEGICREFMARRRLIHGAVIAELKKYGK